MCLRILMFISVYLQLLVVSISSSSIIESQEQLKQTISALRLSVQNKGEQIASKNRELQKNKEENGGQRRIRTFVLAIRAPKFIVILWQESLNLRSQKPRKMDDKCFSFDDSCRETRASLS